MDDIIGQAFQYKTKKQCREKVRDDQYTIDAWQFYSEYNIHMYGWFVLRYLPDDNDMKSSAFHADVRPHERDERPLIKVATGIMEVLGE